MGKKKCKQTWKRSTRREVEFPGIGGGDGYGGRSSSKTLRDGGHFDLSFRSKIEIATSANSIQWKLKRERPSLYQNLGGEIEKWGRRFNWEDFAFTVCPRLVFIASVQGWVWIPYIRAYTKTVGNRPREERRVEKLRSCTCVCWRKCHVERLWVEV